MTFLYLVLLRLINHEKVNEELTGIAHHFNDTTYTDITNFFLVKPYLLIPSNNLSNGQDVV